MIREKSIVLLSSGLDSTVNLYKAIKKTDVQMTLTFDYGQRAAIKEIECARKHSEELKIKHHDAFIFSADDYKTSAVLDFYLDSMVYGQNVIGEPALQFDFIGTDLHALQGNDALFINSIPNFKSDQRENQFPPSLPFYFNDITELDPILIKKDDRTVRKFLVFYCKNYHPKK